MGKAVLKRLGLLLGLTCQYIIVQTAFFFPLALVNILRFSIQGMGRFMLRNCSLRYS